MAHLFEALPLRSVVLPNRIGVPPMCQYSAREGRAQDWHLVHYGGLAAGGAGLVIVEATAVRPEGRISPEDLGLWEDGQIDPLARVARFIADQGSVPAIQLAHAGRKACTPAPWRGKEGSIPEAKGGWRPVAPSALPFDTGWATPEALPVEALPGLVEAFVEAARRAAAAGFRAVELHAAHGYLLHQFLSPLSNRRQDAYGGSFEGRTRLLRELVAAVRAAWPAELPLLLRLSCTDWVEGGWDLPQTLALLQGLKALGVDLVDCSSGGLVPRAPIPVAPGYQVPFAAAVRRETGLPAAAVGLLTDAAQAEAVLAEGQADLVLLGRELLRNPRWPLQAAAALGADVPWPPPYRRAR